MLVYYPREGQRLREQRGAAGGMAPPAPLQTPSRTTPNFRRFHILRWTSPASRFLHL